MKDLSFRVWRGKRMIAACAYAEDAAAVLALSGGEIRFKNRIIFRDGENVEGHGIVRAEDSVDAVAEVVYTRANAS